MAGINSGRVLLGGLAGGVVANACDFVTNGYLMAEESRMMAQRLNLRYETVNSTSTMVTWIVIDFLYATLIVWVYAAVRPRLGPGAQTAMIAGLVVYASSTIILFGFQQMGIFTPDAFMKSAFYSLVTTMLTSLAGARLYRED